MPTFLMFSRHSPENCPAFNERARKAQKELFSKLDELLKKHGGKRIGAWVVTSEHLAVGVFDIPSLEAFQKLSNEPEIVALGAFETTEYKVALSLEEVQQNLQQIQ